MPSRRRSVPLEIPADVSAMDRQDRVLWLQRRGYSDRRILDALLDPRDPELDHFMARDIASLTSTQH